MTKADGELGSLCPQCGEPQTAPMTNSQERTVFVCGPCVDLAKARRAELLAASKDSKETSSPASPWWRRWLSPNSSSGT